jgi:SAM-dependent methyltransferase/uncharacterized protein YbaR (Trm112 family)
LSVRIEALRYFCCPACHGDLRPEHIDGQEVRRGNLLCTRCGRSHPLRYGIPHLTWPAILPEADAHWMAEYDAQASTYDRETRNAARFMGFSERRERQDLVDRLGLQLGQAVLEVSVGTGSNVRLIADGVGPRGVLFGLDISEGMLRRCRAKLRRQRIRMHLCMGNASYLPFRDSLFDAVLHSGGINTFAEPARAIQEMLRVARSDARVVISDEGLSPELRHTDLGRRIIEMNALYASEPPLGLVPADAVADLRLGWICRGLFYVLDMRKV